MTGIRIYPRFRNARSFSRCLSSMGELIALQISHFFCYPLFFRVTNGGCDAFNWFFGICLLRCGNHMLRRFDGFFWYECPRHTGASKEVNKQRTTYTYPQTLVLRTASSPGSILNRHGGGAADGGGSLSPSQLHQMGRQGVFACGITPTDGASADVLAQLDLELRRMAPVGTS